MAQFYTPQSLAGRVCVFAVLICAFWCSPTLAASWTVEGRVVSVSDGDTIAVLDRAKVQHKIRLSGIDAPEKGQPFADKAKGALSFLVFGNEIEAHCHKKDRYGREVCKVMRESMDVNFELLRAGFAWWYSEYASEQTPEDRARYAAAENDARTDRAGLWKDANPVPPWDFRKDKAARQ